MEKMILVALLVVVLVGIAGAGSIRVCSRVSRGLSKVNSTSNPNQATNSSAPGSSESLQFHLQLQ